MLLLNAIIICMERFTENEPLHLIKPGGGEKRDEKRSYADLKREDTALRTKLEKRLPDDPKYFAGLERAGEFLREAEVSSSMGLERARSLIAADAALQDVWRTERGRLTRRFIALSEE